MMVIFCSIEMRDSIAKFECLCDIFGFPPNMDLTHQHVLKDFNPNAF